MLVCNSSDLKSVWAFQVSFVGPDLDSELSYVDPGHLYGSVLLDDLVTNNLVAVFGPDVDTWKINYVKSAHSQVIGRLRLDCLDEDTLKWAADLKAKSAGDSWYMCRIFFRRHLVADRMISNKFHTRKRLVKENMEWKDCRIYRVGREAEERDCFRTQNHKFFTTDALRVRA